MSSLARAVAERLRSVEWAETDYLHTHSRALLMKEYLRRSALWARELQSHGWWPFFDVSHVLLGHDAAPATLLAEVRETLEEKLVVGYTSDMAVAAVNFAAMRNDEMSLPDLPDLYEPLLVMFERGGGFTIDRSGMVDVDSAGVPMRSVDHNATLSPVVALDSAALDAIDIEFERRR